MTFETSGLWAKLITEDDPYHQTKEKVREHSIDYQRKRRCKTL